MRGFAVTPQKVEERENMKEIDVKKCQYYTNHYEDKYRNNFFNYCYLYEDKCDKYPQCIYRDKQLQQLKEENEELKKMNHNLSEKFANVCGGCFEQELREKYKQCLNEIEEMCKHDCEYECSNNSNECGICSCLEQRIQRKIKEVRGEE